jgi:GT2 family glycosyltransferase
MNNICAVIVTYGNRFNLLTQVIESAFKEGVDKIIVVDNNSDNESKTRLVEYAENYANKIIIICLPKNIGSAGGFKKGIEEALKNNDNAYILLLDDDNMVTENCIKILLERFNEFESNYGKENLAISSLRVKLKQLDQPDIEDHTFLGFHFKYLPRKLNISKKNIRIVDNLISKTAPYGGLFFHKSLIKKYGMPNSEFILYGDDGEFTFRISKNGGKILLAESAKIFDLENKFGCESKSFNIFTYFNANKSKVYYALRNFEYFEVHCKHDRTIMRNVNKFIYIMVLRILALLYHDRERFNVIMDAVKDGKKGKLGYNENYPL